VNFTIDLDLAKIVEIEHHSLFFPQTRKNISSII